MRTNWILMQNKNIFSLKRPWNIAQSNNPHGCWQSGQVGVGITTAAQINLDINIFLYQSPFEYKKFYKGNRLPSKKIGLWKVNRY